MLNGLSLFSGIRRYVSTVRGELEALEYDCRDGFAVQPWTRWFLLAKAKSPRLARLEFHQRPQPALGLHADLVLEEISEIYFRENSRKDHELPRPMDRIKSLGNAVVPIQAKEAFKRLMGLDTPKKD